MNGGTIMQKMQKNEIYTCARTAINNTMVVFGYVFCTVILVSFVHTDVFEKVYMARVFLLLFFIASFSGDFFREIKKYRKN